MDLVVLQHGRERQVRAIADGHEWIVTVDGKTYRVDVARLVGGSRSFIVDSRHFEVSVRRSSASEFVLGTAQRIESVEVLEPLAYAARQADPQQAERGADFVTAYMPGRVAALLVESGQAVKAGEGLVVLEAMKMENEIKAGHAGVVGEIFVAVGDAVEGGDRLVEVK
jgi:biotin carboxyl carrier protein